jgi:hypothetical protein
MADKCRSCAKSSGGKDWCSRCWKLVPTYYKREFVRLRRANQQGGRTWLNHLASATVAVQRALAGTDGNAPTTSTHTEKRAS